MNTYSYVDNNPLTWVDPDGLAKVIPWRPRPVPLPGTSSRPGATDGDTGGAGEADDGGTGTRERPERCDPQDNRPCQNVGQYVIRRFKPGDIEYDASRPGLVLYRCDYLCPNGATFSKMLPLREGFGGCPKSLPPSR